MEGEVFEYIGKNVFDGDPDEDGPQLIDLSIEDYYDTRLWKQVSVASLPAEVQARGLNSSIHARDAITLKAEADQTINSLVFAGAMAVAGGGAAGVGVGGAGVSADNRIATLVTAAIDGDGAATATDGISAGSISITATDASMINAVAAAASIAAGVGGGVGAGVSIGISVAHNLVANQVLAYIANADEGVVTANGTVSIQARSQGDAVNDVLLGGMLLTVANLNNAAKEDDSDNESANLVDALGDRAILDALRAAFSNNGVDLAADTHGE